MIGGKFTHHPPKEVLPFRVRKQDLTDGCGDFALDEEPYRGKLCGCGVWQADPKVHGLVPGSKGRFGRLICWCA